MLQAGSAVGHCAVRSVVRTLECSSDLENPSPEYRNGDCSSKKNTYLNCQRELQAKSSMV